MAAHDDRSNTMAQSGKEIPIEYIGQTTDDNTTSGFVAKRVVERTEIERLQWVQNFGMRLYVKSD